MKPPHDQLANPLHVLLYHFTIPQASVVVSFDSLSDLFIKIFKKSLEAAIVGISFRDHVLSYLDQAQLPREVLDTVDREVDVLSVFLILLMLRKAPLLLKIEIPIDKVDRHVAHDYVRSFLFERAS